MTGTILSSFTDKIFARVNIIQMKIILITKQGLIATQLSVLEALVIKIDETIHPWYYAAETIHPWLLQHTCTVDSVQCSGTGSA